ncbi:DUF3307 domain-containing protein [Alteromonas genovensis]|uniref:DUF3307 domain-containing protein n=1 Tax=Alteromonas genovensis TaxID=471225 RepID=UPI002FE324D4
MEATSIEALSTGVLSMGEIATEQLVLLVGLLLAHVLGDFYFQSASWVKSRNTKHLMSPALYLHALLHGVLAFFALLILSLFATLATKEIGAATTGISTTGLSAASVTAIELTPLFFVSIGVMVTHFIIDAVKSYASPTTFAFVIDQAAHIIVAIILWALLTQQFTPLLQNIYAINYHHLVLLLAYLVILSPTSIFIKQLLLPWTKELEELTNPKRTSELVQLPVQRTLAMAGQRIGYLERLLILTFVLLNQFAAIGFLIAAKSIFRFGDLTKSEDKKLTEYVLLGTLTSVAITIATGLVAKWCIGTL